jgi:hypothetical protein
MTTLIGCGSNFKYSCVSNCSTPAQASVTTTTNSSGVHGFALAGNTFVPLGVNYLIEGHGAYNGNSYQTFDMFDTQNFSASTIDQNMQQIASYGFTYVRLWLKGVDTDNGFSSPNAWSLYVNNIVTTIHSAQKYNLHVVLTGSFPGPTGNGLMPTNYQPAASLIPSNVTGMNQLMLVPAVTQQLGQFYHDLLTAMLVIDPNIASGIFYFDLYNEIHYDLTSLPLSANTGTFPYNGVSYNLNDFSTNDTTDSTSRQALMDIAAQNTVQTLGSAVKAVMPNLLVTPSSGFNRGSSHAGFDGGLLFAPGVENHYSLRTYYVLQGGADFIDIHLYPSAQFQTTSTMISSEIVPVSTATTGTTYISAKITPLLSGEFGDTYSSFSGAGSETAELEAGISQMLSAESSVYCAYNFAGFGVWDWNTYPNANFTLVDPIDDPGNLYMQAMAPLYNPQYCGQPVVSTDAAKTTNSSVPFLP